MQTIVIKNDNNDHRRKKQNHRKITSLQEEVNDYRNELHEATDEVFRLKEIVDNQRKEIKQLKQKLAKQKQENQATQQQIEEDRQVGIMMSLFVGFVAVTILSGIYYLNFLI